MKSTPPATEEPTPSRVPPNAVRAMIIIVVTIALVAIYAGVQRFRRDKIEQVIIIPAASVSPSPEPP